MKSPHFIFDNVNTADIERVIESGTGARTIYISIPEQKKEKQKMTGAKGLFESRRFWTMLIYAGVSIVLYFVGKYAGAAEDDVKFLIAALLPIALALVAAYTVDYMQQARLEMTRVQMDALKK